MERELVERFVGILVMIKLGKELFIPPPGTIESVGEDYFVYKTPEKTSVLSLSDLKAINPV